jgi:hypothetical protein
MIIDLTMNIPDQEAVIPVVTLLTRKISTTMGTIMLMTHIHRIHVIVGATKQPETHPQLPPPPLVAQVQQRCSFQVTDAMMPVSGPDDKLTMTQTDDTMR